LEQRSAATHAPQAQQQLLLVPPSEPGPSPVLEALDEFDPDSMSPKEALEAMYRLKKLSRD
jgi:DNA mismatch repair protein MutS